MGPPGGLIFLFFCIRVAEAQSFGFNETLGGPLERSRESFPDPELGPPEQTVL